MLTQKLTRLSLALGFAGAAGLFVIGGGVAGPQPSAEAQESSAARNSVPELKPVEPEPHDFMEYINRPTYLRLKQAIGAEPKNEEGWESITSNGLILAEVGNLLMMRPPEENVADWKTHAAAIRHSGGELYRAAQEKDYPTARRWYQSLISECNGCHAQFNNGKPNLQP